MFCIYSNFNSVNMRLNIWTGWPFFTKLHMNVVCTTGEHHKVVFRRIYKIAKMCLSVWNNSAPTGRIFMKFAILLYFRKYVEKLQVWLKPEENSQVLYLKTCVCTCMIISEWILRRTRNLSQEICRENQNKHSVFSIFFYENHAVCKITWKNIL